MAAVGFVSEGHDSCCSPCFKKTLLVVAVAVSLAAIVVLSIFLAGVPIPFLATALGGMGAATGITAATVAKVLLFLFIGLGLGATIWYSRIKDDVRGVEDPRGPSPFSESYLAGKVRDNFIRQYVNDHVRYIGGGALTSWKFEPGQFVGDGPRANWRFQPGGILVVDFIEKSSGKIFGDANEYYFYELHRKMVSYDGETYLDCRLGVVAAKLNDSSCYFWDAKQGGSLYSKETVLTVNLEPEPWGVECEDGQVLPPKGPSRTFSAPI